MVRIELLECGSNKHRSRKHRVSSCSRHLCDQCAVCCRFGHLAGCPHERPISKVTSEKPTEVPSSRRGFFLRMSSRLSSRWVIAPTTVPHRESMNYEYCSPIIRSSIPDTSCMRRNKCITTASLLIWHLPLLLRSPLMSLDWSTVLGT